MNILQKDRASVDRLSFTNSRKKRTKLFPKEYDKFILNLFRDIEKHDGRDKIDEIFKWRKNRIIKDVRETLSNKKTLQDRMFGLKDILEAEGYFAELTDMNNHFTLKLYNCPIFKLASEFKEVCLHDLQMFREIIGKELSREECIVDGNNSCTYTITKTLPKTNPKATQKHFLLAIIQGFIIF